MSKSSRDARIAQIISNPLLREKAGSILRASDGNGVGPPLRRVEDVIFEMLMLEVALLETPRFLSLPPGASAEEYGEVAAKILRRSVPYLWTYEMWTAAIRMKIPEHVVSHHILPHPAVYITTNVDLAYPDQREFESVQAMVVCDISGALFIITFGKDYQGKFLASSWAIATGLRWPQDYPHSKEVGALLGLFSFLNSPASEVEARRLPRPMRRRMEHSGSPAEFISAQVNFVTLRRHSKPEDYDSHPVDWRVRWLVSGHQRAQWCPSTRTHKLIWIQPYVKGPEDKPFKSPAFKVIR